MNSEKLCSAAVLMAGMILVPARGLADNSVTLTDLTQAVQSNRPFSISRVFVQGEIANCAQPQVGGTPLTTWQCDRMNAWPDGSLKHAIISFLYTIPAGGSVNVSFVNSPNASSAGNSAATAAAALTQGQMLSFDPGTGAGTWGADIEAASGGATQTANARTMLTAGNWRYRLQGPVVTQIVVEDRSPVRSYDFGWQCMSNCTGNYAAVSWSQAPAASIYQSLHPIFVATFYPGWSGVQVDYILEDSWADRLQDQAYSLALKAHSDLSAVKYTHPTFWQNPATRWRRRYWDGTTPGRVKTDLNFPYLIQSRAVAAWDQARVVGCCGPGTAGGLEIAAFQAGMTDPSTFLTDQPENLLDPRSPGEYVPDMGTTGGRGEMGPLPRWDVRWMYSMDEGLYRVMLANANSLGGIPVHIRESRTDNHFLSPSLEPTPSTSAFGRFLSVDARPTGDGYNFNDGVSADHISMVGPGRCSNLAHSSDPSCTMQIAPDASTAVWYADMAHFLAVNDVAYLATGDWYYLETLYAIGQWGPYFNSYGTGATGRNGSTGYINEFAFNIRGGTWPLRNLAFAAFMAPSQDKEALYLNEKLDNNLAVREGKFNITSGRYFGTPAWNFGNTAVRGIIQSPYPGAPAATTLANPWSIPDYAMYSQCPCPDGRFTTMVNWPSQVWQENYHLTVLGMVNDMGFGADQLLPVTMKFMINQVQSPGTSGYHYNPYLIGTYISPALDLNNNWLSGQAMWDSWTGGPAWHDMTTWPTEAYPSFVEHAYNLIALTAASFAVPYTDPATSLSGSGSYQWLVSANAPYTALFGSNTANCGAVGLDVSICDNPKWALVPRSSAPPPPPPAPNLCDVNKDGVVDRADVELEVNQALQLASPTNDINGDGIVDIVDVQRVVNASLGGSCVTTP